MRISNVDERLALSRDKVCEYLTRLNHMGARLIWEMNCDKGEIYVETAHCLHESNLTATIAERLVNWSEDEILRHERDMLRIIRTDKTAKEVYEEFDALQTLKLGFPVTINVNIGDAPNT